MLPLLRALALEAIPQWIGNVTRTDKTYYFLIFDSAYANQSTYIKEYDQNKEPVQCDRLKLEVVRKGKSRVPQQYVEPYSANACELQFNTTSFRRGGARYVIRDGNVIIFDELFLIVSHWTNGVYIAIWLLTLVVVFAITEGTMWLGRLRFEQSGALAALQVHVLSSGKQLNETYIRELEQKKQQLELQEYEAQDRLPRYEIFRPDTESSDSIQLSTYQAWYQLVHLEQNPDVLRYFLARGTQGIPKDNVVSGEFADVNVPVTLYFESKAPTAAGFLDADKFFSTRPSIESVGFSVPQPIKEVLALEAELGTLHESLDEAVKLDLHGIFGKHERTQTRPDPENDIFAKLQHRLNFLDPPRDEEPPRVEINLSKLVQLQGETASVGPTELPPPALAVSTDQVFGSYLPQIALPAPPVTPFHETVVEPSADGIQEELRMALQKYSDPPPSAAPAVASSNFGSLLHELSSQEGLPSAAISLRDEQPELPVFGTLGLCLPTFEIPQDAPLNASLAAPLEAPADVEVSAESAAPGETLEAIKRLLLQQPEGVSDEVTQDLPTLNPPAQDQAKNGSETVSLRSAARQLASNLGSGTPSLYGCPAECPAESPADGLVESLLQKRAQYETALQRLKFRRFSASLAVLSSPVPDFRDQTVRLHAGLSACLALLRRASDTLFLNEEYIFKFSPRGKPGPCRLEVLRTKRNTAFRIGDAVAEWETIAFPRLQTICLVLYLSQLLIGKKISLTELRDTIEDVAEATELLCYVYQFLVCKTPDEALRGLVEHFDVL